jgi:homoserine dehydrogenase
MSNKIVVIKFGSSVLRTARDLPSVVSEVYRHVRQGKHVIAVVSAFAGVTDRILVASRAWTPEPDAQALATAVATGEMDSATQLVFALERAGIPVSFLDPRDVSFRTRGDRLNAVPVSIDAIRLRQIAQHFSVTVVPGFYGLAEGHGIALLGRGGSDLTAVYLTRRLSACCILVKDVDGLYETDPAREGPRPRRFDRASYDDAIALGGELVQPKAVEEAREANQRIEICSVGEHAGTVIGPHASSLATSPRLQPLRILLCGLGTVGRGVYEFLAASPERYEFVGVLVRTLGKHVDDGVPPHLLLADPSEAIERCLSQNADVVIECLGGSDPAHRITFAALGANRTVITANKELISKYWDALTPYLLAPNTKLYCSAAVGGAAPMMELVRRLKTDGHAIRAIRGVLNGTCNFILDRLMDGVHFEDAVREAQVKGYAEPDPAADLDGLDAARKLEILCRLAFGAPPARLHITGIRNVTPASTPAGAVLRLVATIGIDRVACVVPEPLAEEDFLGGARGAENRLEVITVDGAIHRVSGVGAGRYPTAVSILADLLDASLNRHADRLPAE